MGVSRRKFLAGLGATAVAGVAIPADKALGDSRSGERQRMVTLTGTATRIGEYLYLPFDVPEGVARLEGKLTEKGGATLGFGVFDQRGPGYESPGFRGIYGAERSEFFLTSSEASRSFSPGRIEAGTWTLIVPVFNTVGPAKVRAEVALLFGPQGAVSRPGPSQEVVKAEPGWYRGELHCHTPESSDAAASGSALTAAGWADKAAEIGLDFVSLTDHNVITQNRGLKAAAEKGVLLMAGEEMTNWFHGHATVTGLEPGQHLDWRQRPLGVPLEENEARIQRFTREARRLGTYTSAAHPFLGPVAWQFFPDAEADSEALPDGIEVWNGNFQPDDEAALKKWDELLLRGHRVPANGGSDTHGIENTGGFAPGQPTNVVYAEELSKEGMIAALKNGRLFITRKPDGAELYLSAKGPEGQSQMVGGEIRGDSAEFVTFSVLVRRGAGMTLVLLRDGAPVKVARITKDEQTVDLEQPVGAGGYVRAELLGSPEVDPENPLAGRSGMEALTNPIFLSPG